MLEYCYSTKDGEVVIRTYPMGKQPCFIRLRGGRVATRDYRTEARGMTLTVAGSGSPCRGRPSGKAWPQTCFASGVNAGQANELRAHFEKSGCSTEVTPDGDPVYTSAAHRKKALKCRGLFDRSSFN